MRGIAATTLAAALLAALAVLAGPAAADPPSSSGVVERFLVPEVLLFPDFEHSLVAYVNITRDDFCSGSGGPQADWNILLVSSPSSAELVRIQAPEMPIHLHRFEGTPLGPCDPAIEEEPSLVGTADVVLNDNELCPCQNNRTNSFGHRGHGTMSAPDGAAWRYSWNWRGLIDKEDGFRIANEQYVLLPVGG